MTAKYVARLVEVVRRRPRSLDLPFSLWTCQRLTDYMAEETGIRVSAGLPLAGIHIDAGENDYAVDFPLPNPAQGGTAQITLRRGNFRASGLLNSGFHKLTVHTQSGSIHLTFDGMSLETLVTVRLHSSKGDMRIEVPPHIPARIVYRTISGAALNIDAHYHIIDSTSYETGSYHLTDSPRIDLEIETMLGDLCLTGI